MVDTVADGPKNVVAAAERWSDEFLKEVVEMPCESDDDFFVKASYLLDCERNAWGLLTADEPFGRLALATELHSISRAQLRVRRIRERIMEEQQKHATSLDENVTTGDA
jgi:hypothetical protein